MIIVNGCIECKIKTGGGINPETGHPVKTSATWGKPIPCQYIPSINLQARTSGEPYTGSNFTILIEEMRFEAEQVRLRDLRGNVLGEYSIKAVEVLRAVCELKLTI